MMELCNIPIAEFSGLIEAQKHGIKRAFQLYSDEMNKQLKYVCDPSLAGERFLTGNRNTKQLTENDMKFGYFPKMMRPMYTEVAEVKGK
jgi:hypothetical protein